MSYILCTLNRRVMFKSKLSDREAGAGGQSTIIYDLDRKPLGCFREIDDGWDASLEVEDEFGSLCEGEPFRNIESAVTEVLSARKV